jgi:hypothetical protein
MSPNTTPMQASAAGAKERPVAASWTPPWIRAVALISTSLGLGSDASPAGVARKRSAYCGRGNLGQDTSVALADLITLSRELAGMEAYTTAKGGASSSEAGLYDAAATSSLFSDYRRSATALILAEHIRVGAHEAVEVCFAQH